MLKQQLQGGLHSNTVDAVKALWARGGVRGLYQGLGGQLARDIPFRATQMTTYEVVRRAYVHGRESRRATGTKRSERLSGAEGVVVGAVAGSIAAAATNPLDVLKTRLMTSAGGVGVYGMARRIVVSEGIGGMFRGVVPRVVYIGPSCAIFFMVYETVKSRMADM